MDFKYTTTKRTFNTSHKHIKLTTHCVLRAKERLNIGKKEEIRKLAGNAKTAGVKLSSLRKDTFSSVFGLNFEEYVFLKSRFPIKNNSTSIYLYKNNIFIFVGKNQNTLKTIISLQEIKENIRQGKDSFNSNFDILKDEEI